MKDLNVCQKLRCKYYLTDEGEPAWCFRAGCPAVSAVAKCPKVAGKQEKKGGCDGKESN